MGGILAMMHAFRLPGAVKGLVVLDPPVPRVSRWARDPRLTAKLAFLRMPGVAALVARHGRPARQSRGRACAGREPPEWGFRAREEVGHLPHLEDPAWTVQSIEEWLDHQVKSP
jgi:pimeloyl-ACP methyl ester carboxylesterase